MRKALTPPLRKIFIAHADSKELMNLISIAKDTYVTAKDDLDWRVDRRGYKKFKFKSGDEILVFYHDEKPDVTKLTAQEIRGYKTYLFFDMKLPVGAERAYIEKLGLNGYVIAVGICAD